MSIKRFSEIHKVVPIKMIPVKKLPKTLSAESYLVHCIIRILMFRLSGLSWQGHFTHAVSGSKRQRMNQFRVSTPYNWTHHLTLQIQCCLALGGCSQVAGSGTGVILQGWGLASGGFLRRERGGGGDSVGWSLGRNVTCPWRMKAWKWRNLCKHYVVFARESILKYIVSRGLGIIHSYKILKDFKSWRSKNIFIYTKVKQIPLVKNWGCKSG